MWCFSRKPQSWAGSPGPEKVPSGAQDFPRSTFSLRVDVSVCVCVCVCVCSVHASLYPQSGSTGLCWTWAQGLGTPHSPWYNSGKVYSQ